MNLPNRITISRIILIFGMIIAMFVLAFIPDLQVMTIGNSGINLVYLIFTCVFIIAAFTDMLDGKIARKYHTSVKRLCALNKIRPNTTLKLGRKLRVK